MKNYVKAPIPYKIKMVEPVSMIPTDLRRKRIEEARYNVFNLRSKDIYIDLLTDSGTGAMSDRQWAHLLKGDEAYAGSESFAMLQAAVQTITGYPYMMPVHQGRGAERVFFDVMLKEGDIVPSNTHFDTTFANLRNVKAKPVNLPAKAALDPESEDLFKGNIDVGALDDLIRRSGVDRIPFVMMTLTNNAAGGHPASLQNLKDLRSLLDRYGIPLFIDAARFAENAFLLKQRTPSLKKYRVTEVARMVFDLADGCLMSAKKDGLVPIGGFIAVRDRTVYDSLTPTLVTYEGFKTYGGLAGHDMAALAVGLQEVMREDYLAYRVYQVAWLHDKLEAQSIPVVSPPGGHAVFLVADYLFPHIPRVQFPGQALTIALYLEGGIRAVEIGSLMMAYTDPGSGQTVHPAHEYVRLAIPRRVYTLEHLDYVYAALASIAEHPHAWPGFRIVKAPPVLRHFLADLEPLGPLP